MVNLLTLARAGESGKGFTVVADEVRKLAEQSANTVMQINQIAGNINEKMQLVLDKVENGNHAVRTGGTIVIEVDDSFNKISSSFREIDEYTNAVQEMMLKTAEVFNKIRSESEGMASIAEEHSAATEEMLSTMEEQNAKINSIFELIQMINTSSDNLRGMLQNKEEK